MTTPPNSALNRISAQASWERKRFGVIYVLNVHNYHPQLRRSQVICIASMLYATIIIVSCIIYAAMAGI